MNGSCQWPVVEWRSGKWRVMTKDAGHCVVLYPLLTTDYSSHHLRTHPMAQSAKVLSIQALKDFRVALINFTEEARNALSGVDMELKRMRDWLERDQLSYWQMQVKRRHEAMMMARTELYRRENLPAGQRRHLRHRAERGPPGGPAQAPHRGGEGRGRQEADPHLPPCHGRVRLPLDTPGGSSLRRYRQVAGEPREDDRFARSLSGSATRQPRRRSRQWAARARA